MIIATISLIIISCSDTTSPDDANYSFILNNNTMNVADSNAASLKFENIDDLFVFSAEMVYDPNMIEIEPEYFSIGSIWNNQEIYQWHFDSDSIFSMCIGLKQSDTEDIITGSGKVMSIEFVAKAIGNTDMELKNINVLDENGQTCEGFENIEDLTVNIEVN